MAQLEIVDVSKGYDRVRVLSGINLSIQSGEFVVFVGPSGCGKSTLLRMISGLEEITSGEIRLDGKVVNNVDPAKRGIAMVFQSYALYPHMTVAQNMAFALTMAREPKAVINQKVGRAAEILRLEKLLDRKPGQLSGGQKQRVAIGRAIVRDPKVFLFDEPLSNLDAELRVQMRTELRQLHKELGTTMIYVTHDQVEAMTLADRMVVMNGGKVQQSGRPLALYDRPANTFVAGFIGSPKMNFLKASVEAVAPDKIRVANVGGAEVPIDLPFQGFDSAAKELQLGFRPENIRIVSAPSGPGTIELDVVLVEELGGASYIHGVLTSGERLIIHSSEGRYSGGSRCLAALDLKTVHIFDPSGLRIEGSSGR